MREKFKKFLKRQMFYPGFISLAINSSYIIRKEILRHVKKNSKYIRGDVLDVGCGSKPYEKLFVKKNRYVGLDIKNSGHSHNEEIIDVFYNGNRFPFGNLSFDSVVSFEVLEHVRDLDLFVKEIYRVIKKGGYVLLTTPFIWPLHETPNDYQRITPFHINKLFNKHGFNKIEITTYGRGIGAIFQMANSYFSEQINRIKNPLKYIFYPFFIFPINLMGVILHKILPKTKNLYIGNVILAKK